MDVRLRVATNREQLVALMSAGDVDLSIMGRPPREVATRAESFAAHPLVFVAPPDHPLVRRGEVPIAALANQPLIVREHGSGTRAAMEGLFADHRFEPRISMELSSNETIKQAVMAGMGLSFISLHTVGLELSNGLLAILDVSGTPLIRMWNVVYMGGKVLSPSAEAFRHFVIEHGEAHLVNQDAAILAHRAPRPAVG